MRVNPYTRLLPLSSPVREPKKKTPSRDSPVTPSAFFRRRCSIPSLLVDAAAGAPSPSHLLGAPSFPVDFFFVARRSCLLSTFLPSPTSVPSPQGDSSVGRLSPGAHFLRHSSLWSISSPKRWNPRFILLSISCIFFFWNGKFQVCILNFIYDNKIEVNIAQLSLLSNFNVIGALECYGFQHVV